MAIKNQSIVVTYFAWDTSNSVGKTGDAGNHTIYVSIDGVANAVDDTSSTEVDSTNLQGAYQVTLTAAEMNGNTIYVGGESSTSDIIIIPTSFTTERGDLATVDGNVDSILADTGTDGVKIGAAAITATAIDADAITSAKIADNAIAAEHIAANAIGASELATDAIGAAQIADDAIDAGAIAAGAIGASEIATDAIGAAELAASAVSEIWTSALTEAYASDGSAFTAAQALFQIWAFLAERVVSGTTMTVKELDGSTTAMTFTLNDAAAPSELTRSG